MDVKIRKTLPRDWKVIQKLNNFVFLNDKSNDDDLDLNWPFSKEGIKYYKELANGRYGHCLTAYTGKKAVGYVALVEKEFDYRKGKYIEIDNMGIDPKYRSRGIGKRLLEAATKLAKTQGATKLYVSAYWRNKRAIKFYKNNNFYEIDLGLEKNI